MNHLEILADRVAQGIEQLAGIADPSTSGWTRRAFTEVEREGRERVRLMMLGAGLDVEMDGAGNVVGTLPGRTSAPALVAGSHVDTVEAGGRFDGVVGVVAAIEVARSVREAGIVLDRPFRVVSFFAEELNDFGIAHVGSRAVAGRLTDAHLAAADPRGETLAQALAERAGIDPERCRAAPWRRGEIRAYLELHVEQGPILETLGRRIGVVGSIAGAQRFTASLTGRRDHAGATPMDGRRDALCGAASLALAVEQIARDRQGGVATVGAIRAFPGAANVVPGEAEITGEFRSGDPAWLEAVRHAVGAAAAEAAGSRSLELRLAWPSLVDPVEMDAGLQREIAFGAHDAGVDDPLPISSGAGHDASEISFVAPVGMIFVPSLGGRSHCPEENTDIADIAAGARVLGATLLRLDRST